MDLKHFLTIFTHSITRRPQKLIYGAFFLIVPLIAIFGLISYFFGVRVITSGEGYGFEIGESKTVVYQKATELLSIGKIKEIHAWPQGEFKRKMEPSENPAENTDLQWFLVVDPDWWNNTITLTFDQNFLIEIRRDRICWELP